MAGARTLLLAHALLVLASVAAEAAELRPRHLRRAAHVAWTAKTAASAPTKRKATSLQQERKALPQVGHPEAAIADSAAGELHADLEELMEQRKSAAEMHEAIQADTQLLRESAMLVKATHGRNRVAAGQQLQESERVLKETEVMAHQSRAGWAAGAKEALEEANEVREAARAVATEAAAQLELFGGAGVTVLEAPPAKEVAAPPARLAAPAGGEAEERAKVTKAQAAWEDEEEDDNDDEKVDGKSGGWA